MLDVELLKRFLGVDLCLFFDVILHRAFDVYMAHQQKSESSIIEVTAVLGWLSKFAGQMLTHVHQQLNQCTSNSTT